MNYKQVSSTVDIFRHCSELLQRKDATLHLTLPAEYEAFVDKVASHPPSKKKLCGNAHQDTFWQRSLFSISALTWACVDELVISKASSGLRPFHCSYPGNWMLRPCHRNKATWLFIFICFSILMVICLRKIVICVVIIIIITKIHIYWIFHTQLTIFLSKPIHDNVRLKLSSMEAECVGGFSWKHSPSHLHHCSFCLHHCS